MKVEYFWFASDEQKRITEEALSHSLRYLPFWANEVIVQNCGHKEGNVDAEVVAEPKYRKINILVFDAFFANAKEQQEHILRHEVMHCLIAPITDWCRDVVLKLIETANPDLYTVLNKALDERKESVVEDMAIALSAKNEPI